MSSKNDVMNAWTIYDHIEEYRGKVGLKERDHRAYYESSQLKKKQNEQQISALRCENKDRRVTLAQKTREANERVINTALMHEREKQLALQRKTAEAAVEELDQKSCEMAKVLNQLRYEREGKEKRIGELLQTLERMEQLAHKTEKQHTKHDLQTIRMIENNLDKAKIKYETAKKIQKNYIGIVRCLEEERLTLPKKLRILEQSLEEQKQELLQLKEINKDAHIKRDAAKAEQTQLEQKMIEAKRFRERSLARMKKQAERQKDMQEKFERKARATLQVDDAQQERYQSRMGEDEWVKITSFDDALRRIKDATGVSHIEEIETRFLNQDHTFDHLRKQKASAEKARKFLREQRAQLVNTYEAMKYSGESKMSHGEQLLEGMRDHVEKEEERLENTQHQLDKSARLMNDLQAGVNHLYDTLKDVKLRLPLSNSALSGDPVDVLAVCENKLVHLMTQAKIKDPATAENIRRSPEFQEFMENHLSQENLRINLDEPDQDDSDAFGYDSQDNEDMMTNSDIKKHGQLLMDAKKNKRRARKRKS